MDNDGSETFPSTVLLDCEQKKHEVVKKPPPPPPSWESFTAMDDEEASFYALLDPGEDCNNA